MADVKIIDIDGSQWNIKDQVVRDKIANLETKTTIKEEVLEQNGESFISVVTINDKKFIHLHFNGNIQVLSIGQTIFQQGQIQGMTKIIRGFVTLDKTDGTGRLPADIDVNQNGNTYIYPIIPDKYTGSIAPCRIYGDIFAMIM